MEPILCPSGQKVTKIFMLDCIKDMLRAISEEDESIFVGKVPSEMYLAYILIRQEHGVPVELAIDDIGRTYLLYTTQFPWNLSEREKNLTEEELEEIFSKTFRSLGIDDCTLLIGFGAASRTE